MRRELEVLRDISKITGKGSTALQKELIRENLTDDLKGLLNIAFNPFITTKLNKLKVIEVGSKREPSYEDLMSYLKPLFERKSANNELREIMGRYIGSLNLDEELRNILLSIVTKNLVIGIKEKTINSAAGYELIPNPSLMLAESGEGIIEEWDEIWCEVKYDGIRVVAFIDNDDIKFYSRKFNEVNSECLSRIRSEIIDLLGGDISKFKGENAVFLDGELTDFNRKTVSGKFNKILKGTAPKDIDKDFLFNVFDFEFLKALKGDATLQYYERRVNLEAFFSNKEYNHLKLGEAYKVYTKEGVLSIYDRIVQDGGEGVICKTKDHYYVTKRSKDWIKFKQIQECELIVVGVEEGEGKRTGYIGSLICESRCGKLKVQVGSGFSDKELELMNELRESGRLLGLIVTVKYNERITDKYGNYSLFLPRFVDVRYDKDVANKLEEIL